MPAVQPDDTPRQNARTFADTREWGREARRRHSAGHGVSVVSGQRVMEGFRVSPPYIVPTRFFESRSGLSPHSLLEIDHDGHPLHTFSSIAASLSNLQRSHRSRTVSTSLSASSKSWRVERAP